MGIIVKGKPDLPSARALARAPRQVALVLQLLFLPSFAYPSGAPLCSTRPGHGTRTSLGYSWTIEKTSDGGATISFSGGTYAGMSVVASRGGFYDLPAELQERSCDSGPQFTHEDSAAKTLPMGIKWFNKEDRAGSVRFDGVIAESYSRYQTLNPITINVDAGTDGSGDPPPTASPDDSAADHRFSLPLFVALPTAALITSYMAVAE
ncbi:unnamed protein product [Vitrella brassicaformis CCMP3155]|uniref:Reelin domain-containing protein n=1 Tax=Vitrella brassicaformis (strain CCMP3155) TaxID=1169540 RepID=A0A0G4F515_VITBC|nr:unnamed protein product [Vitrella brassicaformis CCMP3155]|eukprot:CEM06815.1 unnamed protein product [Vitrella brassicaformis CCMP3155]